MELTIDKIAIMRNGMACRVLCVDRAHSIAPIVVAAIHGGALYEHRANGESIRHSDFDITQTEGYIPRAPAHLPKIDIRLPVETRDGQEVVLLSDKGVSLGRPIVGQWRRPDGSWSTPCTWTSEGRYARDNGKYEDLLDLVQEQDLWVVKRNNGMHAVFSSAESAKAVSGALARVHVKFVEGQFDD